MLDDPRLEPVPRGVVEVALDLAVRVEVLGDAAYGIVDVAVDPVLGIASFGQVAGGIVVVGKVDDGFRVGADALAGQIAIGAVVDLAA